MPAYVIDKEELKFFVDLEKKKLNKPHPIIYTEDEVLELHTQSINARAWVSYVYER